MRYKVDMHPDVDWFVRHRCSEEERRAFYEVLERLRSEPLKNSRLLIDPQVSRYALRCFRFGTNLAVFKLDPGRNRIWILKCETLKPRRQLGRGRQDLTNRGP